MASKEKNKTLNFNEILINIDSLKSKEEFILIQTSMNEIFMNSSFIKETSSKKEIIMKISHIIFYIDKEKKSDINYAYVSLSFLTLLETKIKNIPSYILEPLLIDNSKIVNLFKNIFIMIYKKDLHINNFQLPSLKNFINFTFKYPDIVNNYFESSFINTSLYYIEYFEILLKNIEILEIKNNDIIQKIYTLKLFDLLYQAFLSDEINENQIKQFYEILDGEELYRDEFIKKYFLFSDYIDVEDFKKINIFYGLMRNFEKFGKLQKIIRKNLFFLSHIMIVNNEYLQKKFFDEILIVLKEKTNILEEIEIYEFYQVFFCIYYLLEKYNGFNYLDIFDSMMKISFIVMERVKDRNKKGIIQLFLRYVKTKMIDYLKSKGAKPDRDIDNKEEENILSEQGTNLLNFDENNKKQFENNIFYFCEIKQDSFKIKFYKYILDIDLELVNKKDINDISTNNDNTNNEKKN